MERRFAPYLGSTYLSFDRVAQQLSYRFNKEIRNGDRPAIRKILNRDVSANCMMILLVARIVRSEKGREEDPQDQAANASANSFCLELSDSWYSVRAAPDVKLCEFIDKGIIRVGTKLLVSNSTLTGHDEGVDPLDPSYDPLEEQGSGPILHIAANSTRLVRWDAKLGFMRPSKQLAEQDGMLLVLKLSDVFEGGGRIPLIDLRIKRRYPLQFLERQSTEGAKARVLTERQENARLEELDNQRQRIVDKYSEEVQSECIKVRLHVLIAEKYDAYSF